MLRMLPTDSTPLHHSPMVRVAMDSPTIPAATVVKVAGAVGQVKEATSTATPVAEVPGFHPTAKVPRRPQIKVESRSPTDWPVDRADRPRWEVPAVTVEVAVRAITAREAEEDGAVAEEVRGVVKRIRDMEVQAEREVIFGFTRTRSLIR